MSGWLIGSIDYQITESLLGWPGYLERPLQFTRWSNEEVERFKVKGSSEEILKEPAFTSLLVETVFKKHIDEIRSDPTLVEEIILAHCLTTSPSELRKMAAQDTMLRDAGWSKGQK